MIIWFCVSIMLANVFGRAVGTLSCVVLRAVCSTGKCNGNNNLNVIILYRDKILITEMLYGVCETKISIFFVLFMIQRLNLEKCFISLV